jgi:hypothetical protein
VTEKSATPEIATDQDTEKMHQAIKMHFKRMDEGTVEDFALLAKVHANGLKALPDLLINMLQTLKSDAIYPIDRLAHSLQSATRALRDNRELTLIEESSSRAAPITNRPWNFVQNMMRCLSTRITRANLCQPLNPWLEGFLEVKTGR